jgi:hypothetical protein
VAEKRILVVTPDKYAVGVLTADWSVSLKFDLGGELGLFPELDLVLRLEPKEALALANVLQRKAAEAEARKLRN